MIYLKRLILITLIITSCQTIGKLKFEADISNELEEVSATEITKNSDLIWTIEDAGNNNNLLGLDTDGNVIKNINISNAKNEDWEDLTSDNEGNLYIGDIGNNNEKRKRFQIYKINHTDLNEKSASADIIEFTLPKKKYSKDFEAFFHLNDNFYIISKETKKFIVLKVPNKVGKHVAKVVLDHNFKGKNNKITSADISEDGKIIVMLNHDKLWKLSEFNSDDFFSGKIEAFAFEHDSQKEGICFKSPSEVLITDERNGLEGGNIYSFKLH